MEEIYDNIAEDIRIRSGCERYKIQIQAHTHELTDQNKTQNEIKSFYESLFKNGDSKTSFQINVFLDKVQLPKSSFNEIDN